MCDRENIVTHPNAPILSRGSLGHLKLSNRCSEVVFETSAHNGISGTSGAPVGLWQATMVLIFSPEIHFLGLCVRRKWSTLLSLWKNKQQRCCQDPQGPGGCSCPVLSPCSRLQFCEHILNQSEPTVRFTVGLPYFLPRAPTVTHPRGCVTVGRHHRTMVACHKPTGAPLGPEIPL